MVLIQPEKAAFQNPINVNSINFKDLQVQDSVPSVLAVQSEFSCI
jgi:hypothetical protein